MTTDEEKAIEEVPPLLVQDTWRDEDGAEHTEEGVLLGEGYLTESPAEGRAR